MGGGGRRVLQMRDDFARGEDGENRGTNGEEGWCRKGGGGVRRRGDGVQERIGDKGEAVKNLRIEGLQKRTREKISRSMI